MIANLVANAVVTAAGVNARWYDVINIITGQTTTTGQLQAASWTVASCSITTTRSANWTLSYCSLGSLSNLASSTATAWSVHLQKPAVGSPGKTLYMKLERSASTINMYTGVFLADGSSSNPSVWVVSSAITTASLTYTVGTGISSCWIRLSTGNYMSVFAEIDGPVYPTTNDGSIGVIYSIGTNNVAVTSMFNSKLNSFFTGTNALTTEAKGGMAAFTRNSSGQNVLPIVPIALTGGITGFASADLSKYTGIYRTKDSYLTHLSTTTVKGETWLVLQPAGSTGSTSYRACVKNE